MGHYIVVRLTHGIVALFVVSIIVFVLVRVSGDAVYALVPPEAPKEQVEMVRQAWGLDKSIPEQYMVWLGNVVQGDLGRSFKARLPVTELILQRAPYSFQLAVAAMIFGLVLALPLGILSAIKRDTMIDVFSKLFAFVGIATPNFWLAMILILFLSLWAKWLPSAGTGSLAHLVLPAISLGFGSAAAPLLRLVRSGMLDELNSDYLQLARAKGVPPWRIILVHALRNAVIPALTMAGMFFASFMSMSVLVETVFAWPGIGRLVYEALLWRDYPVLQGTLLFVACLVLFTNLVVDVLYAWVDPRIRY